MVVGLWGVLLLWGCEQDREEGDAVVARVGSREIRVSDYDRMAPRLLSTAYRQLDPADGAARQTLLNAMVAKELLLLEGRTRGLHRAPPIARETGELETRYLLKVLRDLAVQDAPEPMAEQVETFFHEARFDEEVHLQHVMCLTEAQARQVLAALAAGQPMEALAEERSTHHPTARRGGHFGFMPVAMVLPEVREQILSLEPGQVYPDPLISRYGIHVFRLVARRPGNLEERREMVGRECAAWLRGERYRAYADSLRRARDFTCQWPAEGQGLCTWKGGQVIVTVGLQEQAEQAGLDSLLISEARRLGLGANAQIRDHLSQRLTELVVDSLRREVAGSVEVAEVEMRAFHEAHPELYGERPTVRVLEILVVTEDEAAELRHRIEAGAPMDSLARAHNTREATRPQGGEMWVAARENPLLGPLPASALDSPEGSLHGPLEVPGGFSVFRVEERRQLPASPFESVRRNLQVILRARREGELMDAYLDSLRAAYADSVVVHAEVLDEVLAGYDPQELDRMAASEPTMSPEAFGAN